MRSFKLGKENYRFEGEILSLEWEPVSLGKENYRFEGEILSLE